MRPVAPGSLEHFPEQVTFSQENGSNPSNARCYVPTPMKIKAGAKNERVDEPHGVSTGPTSAAMTNGLSSRSRNRNPKIASRMCPPMRQAYARDRQSDNKNSRMNKTGVKQMRPIIPPL